MSGPFSNATEGDAWMSCWCNRCAHDHSQHPNGSGNGGGCELLYHAYFPDEYPWPEAWAAAPDYWRHLPARIACLKFEPCEPCGGDPGAEERPAQIELIRTDMLRAQREAADR